MRRQLPRSPPVIGEIEIRTSNTAPIPVVISISWRRMLLPRTTRSRITRSSLRDLPDTPPQGNPTLPEIKKKIGSDKERCQHERQRSEELDEHVERWAGGVLEWVAKRVADDGCLVGLAALAAVCTGLDVFLGIVPCTTAVVQDECKEDARDGSHHEETGEGFVLHGDTDDDREPDRKHARKDHVLQCTLGGDVDDGCIVRFLGACHDCG